MFHVQQQLTQIFCGAGKVRAAPNESLLPTDASMRFVCANGNCKGDSTCDSLFRRCTLLIPEGSRKKQAVVTLGYSKAATDLYDISPPPSFR